MGRMEEHYVGLDAQSMRGVLKLHYPLEHGIITDWNDMELVCVAKLGTNSNMIYMCQNMCCEN